MTNLSTTIEHCRTAATHEFYTNAPPQIGFNMRLTPDDMLAFTWRFELDGSWYSTTSNMLFVSSEADDPTTRRESYRQEIDQARHIGHVLGLQAAETMRQAYTKKYFPV